MVRRRGDGARGGLSGTGRAYRIDSLVSALARALIGQSGPDGRALTGPETVLVAVNALEECVNSGGLLSFIETRKEYAPIIIPALRAVGADDTAAILIGALGTEGIPAFLNDPDADYLDDPDGTLAEALDQADSRWQDAGTDLAAPLWAYVRQNAAAFRLPGDARAPPRGGAGLLALLRRWLSGER